MSDGLLVAIGVLFGALASIPFSLLIAVSAQASRRPRVTDLGAAWQQPQPNITIDKPGREIVVVDVAGYEVQP